MPVPDRVTDADPHAHDRAGSAVYIGALSKVLAPALRIGYNVAPKSLITLPVQRHFMIDLQDDDIGGSPTFVRFSPRVLRRC